MYRVISYDFQNNIKTIGLFTNLDEAESVASYYFYKDRQATEVIEVENGVEKRSVNCWHKDNPFYKFAEDLCAAFDKEIIELLTDASKEDNKERC